MVNVTADFPPHNGTITIQYNWPDGATVADLKNAVSADANAPFHGQPTANLTVSVGGGVLADATALANLNIYDVDLVMADEDDDVIPPGYQAPPPSPRDDGGDGGGHDGGGLANGPLNPYQDGVVVWYYVDGAQNGPHHYAAAGGTVAALKAEIIADPNCPLGAVASSDLVVYDGTNWLGDDDPVAGNLAYTVQQAAP